MTIYLTELVGILGILILIAGLVLMPVSSMSMTNAMKKNKAISNNKSNITNHDNMTSGGNFFFLGKVNLSSSAYGNSSNNTAINSQITNSSASAANSNAQEIHKPMSPVGPQQLDKAKTQVQKTLPNTTVQSQKAPKS